VTLDDEDIEAIAQRVTKLLAHTPPAPPRLVDAATLAGMLGVERDWIYAHATELGAIRLGGPTGRLRFEPGHALKELRQPPAPAVPPPPERRPRRRARQPVGGLELIAYES
jgi:hypothetical protein